MFFVLPIFSYPILVIPFHPSNSHRLVKIEASSSSSKTNLCHFKHPFESVFSLKKIKPNTQNCPSPIPRPRWTQMKNQAKPKENDTELSHTCLIKLFFLSFYLKTMICTFPISSIIVSPNFFVFFKIFISLVLSIQILLYSFFLKIPLNSFYHIVFFQDIFYLLNYHQNFFASFCSNRDINNPPRVSPIFNLP